MTNAVLMTQQLTAATGHCRLQAASEHEVVKHSSCPAGAESARASQQSGTTQQRLSASQNHTSVTRTVPDAAKTTTTGGQQPASPDSVNAGQPAKAQASASPPLPKAAHRVVQQTNKAATGVQAVFTAAVTPPPPLLPQQQQQQAVEQDLGTGLDLLEPLLPPEPSEGPEAHAEYQNYLHRWHNGDTIRQRWYRLEAKGLLPKIAADWEDWQHDHLLDTIELQLTNPAAAAAVAAATAAAASGKLRRGRADFEGPTKAAAAAAEPRRVRTRRAPASFQDFHVETPAAAAAAGFPEGADTPGPPLNTDVQPDSHQHPQVAGWGGTAQQVPASSRPQQPTGGRTSMLGSRQFPSHPQQGLAQGEGSGMLSEEFMVKFRETVEMVRDAGHAQGMEGAAALLTDPHALRAFVGALCQHTDNPAAAMHRLVATLAGQQTYH